MADVATVQEKAKRAARETKEKVQEAAEEQKPAVQSAMAWIEEYSPPIFMGLSLASIAASVTLFARKSKDNATFVGLWAPTFLSLGLFYTLIGTWRRKR